ncbi:uncharacterized protein LACBIDRAFT_311503 [Laccaria bicolor S238N-H82]|uniref:Predicted protein n=1 Tax=Laccaria bicolor (strain S238N-H82 / ATCC MYA-4686) TaxID=486041 RepID=B0CXJ4_LACBS|nr:uncharacterized protein LACBIDRAFT_311503 [Laccaria bicolor S238N-H82]EDR12733.1 predicted protein [Laccaria bicolor S238N-H82]|eukprot:XP_001876997.1 predicted protein [Laccaria bicolor S238N-H82]
MQILSNTQSRNPHKPRNAKPSTAIYLCTNQRHKHLPPSIFQCIFIRNIFLSGSISVVVFRTCFASTFDLYNPATFQFIIPDVHRASFILLLLVSLRLHPVFYLPRCITIVGLLTTIPITYSVPRPT